MTGNSTKWTSIDLHSFFKPDKMILLLCKNYPTDLHITHWQGETWLHLQSKQILRGYDSPGGFMGNPNVAAHWLPFIFCWSQLAHLHKKQRKSRKVAIQKMFVYMSSFILVSFILIGQNKKNSPLRGLGLQSISWYLSSSAP